MIECSQLPAKSHGQQITVAGTVICRQRPGTAKGFVFLTIEDETGFSNLVVFQNLFDKYRKEILGSKLLMAEGKLQREGDVIHVQISNQGPQVPEEHLERIFDKFYRITATDRVTGTGLGLSICKGIIEAHDGHIWAENITDGLAFNFTLPLTWKGAQPLQIPMDTEPQ